MHDWLTNRKQLKTGVLLEQLLRRNVQRFRGGLVFKAHRLVSLNSRLESNKEEEEGRTSNVVGEVAGDRPTRLTKPGGICPL